MTTKKQIQPRALIAVIATALALLSNTASAWTGNAAPGANEQRMPPRAPHYIADLDTEAKMHRIYTKGAPGEPMQKKLPPGTKPSQRIQKTSLEGPLKVIGSGLFEIEHLDVVLANIDWRDRGDLSHAEDFIKTIAGTKVTAKCHVRLSNGPLVCEITGDINGEKKDIGAHILGKGWLGWQTEVGAYVSSSAHAMAQRAYWEGAGVWSNPWYFPDGSFRNAYVASK